MSETSGKQEVFEKIREKDRVVLECIRDGDDDIQFITAATTLNNSEVNYCFRKLEELGLITVEKPGGMEERVVNGTRQVFEAPKQGRLTELGEEFLDIHGRVESEEYRKLSYDELVMLVRELESDMEELKQRFDVFTRQVKQRLFEDSEEPG